MFFIALLAQVVIFTNCAMVSNSNDWLAFTAIALVSAMNCEHRIHLVDYIFLAF